MFPQKIQLLNTQKKVKRMDPELRRNVLRKQFRNEKVKPMKTVVGNLEKYLEKLCLLHLYHKCICCVVITEVHIGGGGF